MRAAAAGQTTAAPVLDKGFARVNRYADGVWVTIADPEKGVQCLSNGGVIFGRDAALIVEGHYQPEGAALELAAARAATKAPVMAAIDTHYHLDHTFGNIAYADRHIPIMAHEAAVKLMKERYGDLKGVDKAPLIAPLKQKAAHAAGPEEKERLESDLEFAQWIYDSIDVVTLAYPTQLIAAHDSPKAIDLGGLTVVIEPHHGHTPTDLLIRIPARDLVFTGDLLFYHSYPVAFDADMIRWRKILDVFANYGPGVRFVPGHGPVCGQETVRDQINIFDDLRAHAEKMKRAGVPVEIAEQNYTVPKPYRRFDTSAWHYGIGAALRSYYTGLR